MKHFSLLFLLILSLSASASARPDDSIWERLLQENVSISGQVNYQGFKVKTDTLDTYLSELINKSPQSDWTILDKKAYYINAYNAYTIKLILAKYPINSIKDARFSGKDIWSVRLIKLGDLMYTLHQLENEILRKMDDPRIHFAINCASYSCPRLYNRAYTAANVDKLLDERTKEYINDAKHNVLSPKKIQLSQLFEWYTNEFVSEGQSLIDYLNKYSAVSINEDAKISFLPYNWKLNE